MDWWRQVTIKTFKSLLLWRLCYCWFPCCNWWVAGFSTFAGGPRCCMWPWCFRFRHPLYLSRYFCCSCFTSLLMSLLMLVSLLLLVSLLFQTSVLLNASLLLLFCIAVSGVSQVSRIIDKNVTGSLTRDFLFQVFLTNHLPLAPAYPIGPISNFYENSRRYSQLCVYRHAVLLLLVNKLSAVSLTPMINSCSWFSSIGWHWMVINVSLGTCTEDISSLVITIPAINYRR